MIGVIEGLSLCDFAALLPVAIALEQVEKIQVNMITYFLTFGPFQHLHK